MDASIHTNDHLWVAKTATFRWLFFAWKFNFIFELKPVRP